jgi:hypothetical protein
VCDENRNVKVLRERKKIGKEEFSVLYEKKEKNEG